MLNDCRWKNGNRKGSSNKLVGAGGLIYLKKKSVSRARTKNLQEDKE